MKTMQIILKSLREQVRSYWVLLLTLSMGPFFIFVYFLIIETSKPQYKILIVNNDQGAVSSSGKVNHGKYLADFFISEKSDTVALPLKIEILTDRNMAEERIKSRKSDVLIVIDTSFSRVIEDRNSNEGSAIPRVEFIGDLTSTNYLIGAVWANEMTNTYVLRATKISRPVEVKETALGVSGSINDFDVIVPGILIVSIIMLMFTASIAFVTEIENKTILRLKLSNISAFEFLGGISIVQMMVGILSILLTLLTAVILGFHYTGSLLIMILIAGLTSFSIIAFSLIIAAVTKSANEVLVAGNFPMFLFMFFTGAAFPLKSEPLFTLAGYPVSIQGLMSPSHAIAALNKTLVMNMGIKSILPEIIALLVLTFIYFLIGAILFNRRHLKLV